MDLNNIKEDYVIRNLFREAKIMAKIKHPCIVSLFETMQKTDNTYYIVTEIVNGGDLCTYVKGQRNGKLDEKSTKFFAQQFVSALSYMHQKGIVHRDLKMENVMLNTIQNQIKIVDFGLSNEWSAQCPLKTHCGSPEYAAPELFVTSKVYGPEVDLWSLGIILYGMIVGQLPFVSAKSSSISSQERRKLLVAQINKGMSAAQRKTISCFSFEFRSALNRLLTADSKKRITIKEMIIHPWITENGRTMVRSNPTKKLTAVAHNKIISDISEVSKIDSTEVMRELEEDFFGKIGGMYNILAHRSSNKIYNANQITRCLSDTVTLHLGCKKDKEIVEVPQKRIQNVAGNDEIRYWQTLRPHTMASASSDMNKTKTILITKGHQLYSNHSSASSRAKENLSSTRNIRPQTVQFGRNQEIKESSALHKRQEYSAFVASSFNQRNSKRIKYKKSEIEYDAQNALKRRKECLKTLTPSRGVSPIRLSSAGNEPCIKQTAKISESYLLQRSPIIPKRKQSLDRTSNPKSSTSTSKSRRSSNTKNSSPLNAFMQFIDSHGDILKNGRADVSSRSPKRIPQKSETLRCSDLPNDSRKSPIRIKLKTARPVSCRSNIEGSTVISKREK